MDITILDQEAEALKNKAHDIESLMHSYVTACQGPEIDELKQQLIDVTIKLDEIKENMDKKTAAEN